MDAPATLVHTSVARMLVRLPAGTVSTSADSPLTSTSLAMSPSAEVTLSTVDLTSDAKSMHWRQRTSMRVADSCRICGPPATSAPPSGWHEENISKS